MYLDRNWGIKRQNSVVDTLYYRGIIQGKIKAKKGFIEEQNNIQKTALAKGETIKSADALRHNLRAAELARMTVERESKDFNDLQEQLARHLGKKPKKLLTGQIS